MRCNPVDIVLITLLHLIGAAGIEPFVFTQLLMELGGRAGKAQLLAHGLHLLLNLSHRLQAHLVNLIWR